MRFSVSGQPEALTPLTKRRVNAALGKAVQKRAGIFAGPVVKRDGQQLRAAVLRPVRPRGRHSAASRHSARAADKIRVMFS